MATIYYTASSLDGFLATPDDDVSWLDEHGDHEDTYTPFIDSVGAICMGSATYAFIQRHMEAGHPWPYSQPTWVFSSRKLSPAPGADVRFVSGDVSQYHDAMREAAEGKDVWICGGGGLASQFLEAGLLNEAIVTLAATTLGSGKPLLPLRARWHITSARQLGDGFAELRLRPIAGGP